MTEENKSEDNSLQNGQKNKDSGMKWVIVADIIAVVVVTLLVLANILERSAADMAKEQQEQVTNTSESNLIPVIDENKTSETLKNYDYDLQLTPENCDGVEGAVDLVLITDANYMDFTRVAINSAKETKCPNSRYNFYVMTMDVSESDVAALKALEGENINITVLPQKEADLFYIRDTHVSKTSLLKYYIAEALPQLDKVLYVDSDILVLHDLNKLYQTDISDVYLAAVKDPSWFFENTHVVELNLDERGFYFNSGVMLMNLAKFRQDGLLQKLEDYTNNNFRTYMDQDALNVVVENNVKLLPVEDNTMNFFYEHVDLPKMNEFYDRHWQNFDDVFGGATILHFASSKKPLGEMAPSDQFFRMLQRLWYKYYKPLPPLD